MANGIVKGKQAAFIVLSNKAVKIHREQRYAAIAAAAS